MTNYYNDNLYRLNKIAFHNSANMNFVAIDLTKHTYLQGLNGSGKSSILNAVQIGYLPYTSFDNIDKHFSFKSSKKFTKEETYKFYFPENNSFLIYEFQNPHGTFCQIILKDTQMQFKRIFVEITYDELLNLIWNVVPDNNMGTPKRISSQELLESLKNKEYIILNKRKDLQEVMYHKHTLRKENCRFSVFPAQIDENNIHLISIIFKLANDASNLTPDSLKSIMSEIMDNKCMDKNDKLVFDPQSFIEPLERLEEQRKSITLKRNFLNQKNNIDNNVKLYEENVSSINSLYLSINNHLYQEKESLENEIKELNESLETKKEQISNNKNANFLNTQQIINIKDQIKIKEFNIKNYQENIDFVDERMQNNKSNKNYSSYDEYLTDIRKFIHDKENELKNAEDFDNFKKDLDENKKDLKRLLNQKENINQEINNINELFISDFKNDQASLLFSINSAFSSIKYINDHNSVNTITEFVKLFTIQGNKVYLDNNQFCSLKEYKSKTIEELNKELVDLEERILNIENKIKKDQSVFDKLSNDTDSVIKIKNVIAELNKIVNKTENAKKESGLILQEKESLNSLNKEIDILNNEEKEFAAGHKTLNSEKVDMEERLNSLLNRKKINDNNINKFNVIIGGINLSIIDENENNTFIYSEDMIEELKNKCNNNITILPRIKTDLDQFIHNDIIKDYDKILMSTNSFNEIKEKLIYELNNTYFALDNETKLLETDISQNIKIIIDTIKDFEKYIRQYDMIIAEYNVMLGDVRLSSIEKFRLKIEYEPSIQYFINEIKNIEMITNDPIEVFSNSNILESIKSFSSNFKLSKENDYKIRSNSIIKSLEVEYLDSNTNQYITTSPSTGTNIVISTVILSMIISSLSGSLIISMPINLDETGQIDNKNLRELITFISNKNLALFSASPHPIPKKCGFQKNIRLDQFISFNPDYLISKFRKTIHLNFVEELSD